MNTEAGPGGGPLQELRELARQVEEAADVDSLRPLYYRMKTIVQEHPDDFEIQFTGEELKKRIAERGQALKGQPPPAAAGRIPSPAEPFHPPEPPPAPPPPAAPVSPREPAPEPPGQAADADEPFLSPPAQEGLPTRIETTQREAVTMPPAPPSPPPAPSKAAVPPRKGLTPMAIAAGAAVVTLGIIGLILFLLLGRGGEGGGETVAMEFRTFPAGASLRVDRELRGVTNTTVELSAGEHRIEAILDGYEPVITTISVGPDSPRAINLTLTPHPQTVRLFTDLTSGEVRLDGEPQGGLQEGQLVLNAVPIGEHSLEVVSGRTKASFQFELAPGIPPRILGPVTAENVLAVVISSAGTEGTAHSSRNPVGLALDGTPVGSIGPEGLPLSGVQPGDHQLQLGSGADARELVASFGVSPALTAFLKLDVNAGTLVVVTGENDVVVSLNGRPQRRRTRNGQLRIPQLPVREYRVSVSKEGFEPAPEKAVQIGKGREARVEFELRPMGRMASLRIESALPDAEVLVDGSPRGTVKADGTFSGSGISPGPHTIEIRKSQYKTLKVSRTFEPGGTVTLSGGDLQFQRATGTLRLAIAPAGASVSWRPADGTQMQPASGSTLSLPEGSYILRADAPGHVSKDIPVQVIAGETHDVKMTLDPLERAAVAPKTLGMEGWEDPTAWADRGTWHVRRGGGFVAFKAAPVAGTFSVTGKVFRGKRLQWVVNYQDDDNYLLFEIGRENYFRKDVVRGRTRELLKKEHSLRNPEHYTLSIEISPRQVVNRLLVNDNWVTLDVWEAPDADFTAGKFGLLIEGRDEYGLSNFSFTPR